MISFYRNNRLTSLALLFSTLCLTVACDKGDSKEHLQRGVEYFEKGDYEKAKLELKTSSQSDKDMAETYYYLALLDEKNHQYKAMKENLLKVIELEPKNIKARLKLGKLLLPFGEPGAALEQAETILKDDSQNLDALALKASVFINQKKQAEALVIIDSIMQKNPNFIDAISLKALVFSEKQEPAKALALLDTALKIDPKNIDVYFFKIQLHAKAKNMDAVIADYKSLTTLYPENSEYKVTLAKLYVQMGKKPDAETVLRELVTTSPDAIKPRLMLIDFLMDTAPDKVEEQLQQSVVHFKDEPRRLIDLATWAISRKRIDEAEKMLHQVIDREDDSLVGLSAKMLLAKIAFERNDIAETEKLVGEVLADNSSYNDAKLLQVRVFFVKKQYDKASELLNKILLSQPELEEALLLSAQAFLVTGDQKKANQYFESTLKVNPVNSQAFDYLYDKAIADQKIEAAKEMATTAVRYQPNNLNFLEKLTRANIVSKDLTAAKTTVQQMADIQTPLANDLANYLRAEIFQVEGNCNAAVMLYRELLSKFPGNQNTLNGMAICFDKMNKRSEMIAVLHELQVKNTSNSAINLLLADLLLREKKLNEGVEILTNLIKINPKIPSAYVTLAKLKLAQNDKKAALDAFQQGLKQNPDDIRLSLSLAALYQELGENDAAALVYDAILSKAPDFDVAVNNYASLLTERYSSTERINKAVQLAERFKNSDQSYYRDTYAWALVKSGKANEGATILQDVITHSPDVAIFRYHLGVAYVESGNNGSAIAELQQALDIAKQKGAFSEEKEAKNLLDKIVSKTRGH